MTFIAQGFGTFLFIVQCASISVVEQLDSMHSQSEHLVDGDNGMDTNSLLQAWMQHGQEDMNISNVSNQTFSTAAKEVGQEDMNISNVTNQPFSTAAKEVAGRVIYQVTNYSDSKCESDSRFFFGMQMSEKPGCLNIVHGHENIVWSSCELICSDEMEKILIQTYSGLECTGHKLWVVTAAWDFLLENACDRQESMDPPLRFDDYPSCTQNR